MLSRKKEVPIEELRLGMYVVELDRSWTGTSFAFQGFPISSQGQIEELRAYCRSVFVDPDRESWTPDTCSAGEPHGSTVFTDVVPVEKELITAKACYRACEHALHQLTLTIHQGDVDAHALSCTMRGMVESIQRSPGAILLLNSLRRKDHYELARPMDTAILMVAFGRYLQYPASRLEVLGLAGMLLDVGMMMLPDVIVQAADADDVMDDALVESHVLHSVELIRGARGLPKGVEEVVLLHHERQDGEGYPYGLARDQISADGAIAAVVDGFSKLTSQRPQAGQMSVSRALTLLHKQRGSALHERLTEQFIQCVYQIQRVLPRNQLLVDADEILADG